MDRIAIIGKGKVGRSLAMAIRTYGRDRVVAVLAARAQRIPELSVDIVIIATRDDKIAETAARALAACKTPPRIIAHVSGSQPSTVLPEQKGVARLTLHPIQTFPRPNPAFFKGITWMASSDSGRARSWASTFVRSLGSNGVVTLDAEALALYHAMTVFSSNFITLLLAGVEEIAKTMGQNSGKMKDALAPLMRTSLEYALENHAGWVLTGPIKRRDMETIAKHQAALEKANPDLRKIYDAFLNYGLGM